jgi:Tfp pilus assembly protein PilF
MQTMGVNIQQLFVVVVMLVLGSVPASAAPRDCAQLPALLSAKSDFRYAKNLQLGWRALRCEEADLARQFYEEALSQSPQSEDALLGLALAALTQNRYHESIDLHQVLLQLNPHNVWGHKRIAYAWYLLGQWSLADSAYRRTLELAPDAEDAQLGRAWSLFQLGRRFEARQQASGLKALSKQDIMQKIGDLPDFGVTARFLGFGYLNTEERSHVLGYGVSGFVNYQDLISACFRFQRLDFWAQGLDDSQQRQDLLSLQLGAGYGGFRVRLSYVGTTQDGDRLSDTLSVHSQLDSGRFGASLVGVWTDMAERQLVQAEAGLRWRPVESLSLAVYGNIQTVRDKDESNPTSLHGMWQPSGEIRLKWKLNPSWKFNLATWYGRRVFWVHQETALPWATMDRFEFGWSSEVEFWPIKNLGVILGGFGQMGEDVLYSTGSVHALGGFLALVGVI